MPLKRSSLDIRQITFPRVEAKTPELSFDPEQEITDEDWQGIINYLKEVKTQSLRIFYETYCMIFLVLPTRFSQLKDMFEADLNYLDVINALWRAPLESLLVKKIIYKINDPKFNLRPEQITQLFINKGDTWCSLAITAFYLLYISPQQKAEIQRELGRMLGDDSIKLSKEIINYDQWIDNNAAAATAKVFFPEYFTSQDYQMDLDMMSKFIEAPKNRAFGRSWHAVLQQLLFLKILGMQDVDATAAGFHERASKGMSSVQTGLPLPLERDF